MSRIPIGYQALLYALGGAILIGGAAVGGLLLREPQDPAEAKKKVATAKRKATPPQRVKVVQITKCDHSKFKTYAWDNCWSSVSHVVPKRLGVDTNSREYKRYQAGLIKTQVKGGRYRSPNWVDSHGNVVRDLAKVKVKEVRTNKFRVDVLMSAKVYRRNRRLRFKKTYRCSYIHFCTDENRYKPLNWIGTEDTSSSISSSGHRTSASGIQKDGETRSRRIQECKVHGGVFCAQVAQMYFNGTDGPLNKVRARYFARKSCQGSHAYARGCALLASILNEGIGGPRDLPGAVRAQQRACELGFTGVGCKR